MMSNKTDVIGNENLRAIFIKNLDKNVSISLLIINIKALLKSFFINH